MTSPVGRQRQAAIRTGAIACLCFVVLAAIAWRAHLGRAAEWDLAVPVHPTALTTPEVSRSALLRWKLWTYRAAAPAEEVAAFYRRSLPGWTPQAPPPVAKARAAAFAKGRWWLEVRLATDGEPGTLVRVMLTDVPPR